MLLNPGIASVLLGPRRAATAVQRAAFGGRWGGVESSGRAYSRTKNGFTVRLEAISMLWTIIGIVLVLWLLGFAFHVGGGLIHTLLVVVLILVVYNVFINRKST